MNENFGLPNITPQDRVAFAKASSEMDEPIDNTDYVRKEQYSRKLEVSLALIEKLKIDHGELRRNHPEQFMELCQLKCHFLYNKFTSIFHKLVKDEIDIHLFKKVIYVMRMIEDKKINYGEGSILVGKLISDMFINSGNKQGEKYDQEHPETPMVEGKDISWNEWKGKGIVRIGPRTAGR